MNYCRILLCVALTVGLNEILRADDRPAQPVTASLAPRQGQATPKDNLNQSRTANESAQNALEEKSAPHDCVTIAGIVLKWIRGDKEANFRRAEPMIRDAAAHGAQIVCTTECFLDGYAIKDKSIPLEEYRQLGEEIPEGAYCRKLAALAGELKIYLLAGMLEAHGPARYNTAVLFGPAGQLVGKYRKQKLGHELVRNTPGDKPGVFDTPHGRVGVLICADRTEASIVGRYRDLGADFLLCPSGGMFGPMNNDPIVQARSRETGLPIVFVHPSEFLATTIDGAVAARTLLGDRLSIPREEVGKETDQNRIIYFNLARRAR
jgi:predicted amidohydrolase